MASAQIHRLSTEHALSTFVAENVRKTFVLNRSIQHMKYRPHRKFYRKLEHQVPLFDTAKS